MLHDSKTRLLGEEDHIRTWNAEGGHLKSVGLTLASGVLIFLARWKSIARLLLVTAYVQANTECYYTAAALQYDAWVVPCHTNTSEAALRHVALHLNGMELHINQAAQRGASIVVLPEAALWGAGMKYGRTGVRAYGEEIPSNGTIPCDSGLAQDRPSVRLSCMAKNKKITIVANVLDVVPRSAGDGDEFWNFNANVVFNPNGQIVAIYHKQHLYMEAPTIDQGNVTAPPVFTVPLKSRSANATCGSVRMGTLICADLYFATPWNAATLQSEGVRHLAYPTAWSSSPPLYMAAMLQHGFAHANDVVLIAANSGKHYKNGAGIFDANTVLAQIHSDNHDLTTLIVADVDVIVADVDVVDTVGHVNPDFLPNEEGMISGNEEGMISGNEEGTISGRRLWSQECSSGWGTDIMYSVPCDARDASTGNASTVVHLKAVSADGTVQCKASVRIAGGDAFALLAANETIVPDGNHTDPYIVTGCLLLPCLFSNDQGYKGTIETCGWSTSGSWPAAPTYFLDLNLTAKLLTNVDKVSMWPLAATVVPQDLVYPSVSTLETEFSKRKNIYIMRAQNDATAVASLYGPQ